MSQYHSFQFLAVLFLALVFRNWSYFELHDQDFIRWHSALNCKISPSSWVDAWI